MCIVLKKNYAAFFLHLEQFEYIYVVLHHCLFLDGSKFQVKDTTTEKQYKFSLQRSLEKAKEACLFQGYKIHVTKNVKPESAQMKGKSFLKAMLSHSML